MTPAVPEVTPEQYTDELLEQELQCFHHIMVKTQEILDDSDTFSMQTILDLLDRRDQWIEDIKVLETELQKHAPRPQNQRSERLRLQISEIAKSLVVTDAKLLDILQMKKSGIIKELSKMTENKNEAKITDSCPKCGEGAFRRKPANGHWRYY